MDSERRERSTVTALGAGQPTEAQAHFERLLRFETDCWDVHEALATGTRDFVLLQTAGSADSFAQEHIEGAIHMHHAHITEEALERWPPDTFFVVYCAGPHCNGADRAAAKIAGLGRPVKKMIGGKTGWLDEGFTLVSS